MSRPDHNESSRSVLRAFYLYSPRRAELRLSKGEHLPAPTLDLAMETVSGENVPSIAQAEPWGVNVQTEMADCPVYEADRILSCQNRLGESVTWDSRRQLLHWIDIEAAGIHSLDPKTDTHWIETYPDLEGIGCIVLTDDGSGFVGNSVHDFVLFPAPNRPEDNPKIIGSQRKVTAVLASPVDPEVQKLPHSRLNDGACDRRGRYFSGNLTHPAKRASLWRLNSDHTCTELFTDVCISNGIDFSPDGKTMYYIDTLVYGVYQYDYDEQTGTPSNRRLFALSPMAPDPKRVMSGRFDGICVDGSGNVWAAELGAQVVVGWRPDGKPIAAIRVPQCTTPTICCFGGPELDTMFITSGHSKYANLGDVQDVYPQSGDLFSFRFAPGSEARALLGENWSGGERNRFRR